MISVRLSGTTHSVPAIPRPAKQGPVGSGAMRSTPHQGGTPAVRVPWRSHGFSHWRVQWGTGGTRSEPAQHEQVRPAAPYKGCDVASASQDIQRAPGPGFFSACLRDSPIHRAGPAAGPRSPCAAARSSQALLRVALQGPAVTERSAQLTSPGGGRLQRRGSRSRAIRSLQSGGLDDRQPPETERRQDGGVRASHALLLQSSARLDRARPTAPGNGSSAASTLRAPPRVPHPPGRSSPKMCTGGRRDLCTRLSRFGMRQGTGS
ncbi:hypothetical protein NDU88_000474 [Pleurodeles waltl]|uniref:Uncharacterized protein n=1 Tax=Pleurodeles waltl TaxID=8319 RepID=A0AAV7WJ51_PLEWA|nr:hypothetical protein NDU88_000474 [Pleurodeles waltl]